MTPKEKAKVLIDRFTFNCRECDDAKQCALICVDEILQSHYVVAVGIKSSLYNYWFDVKQEIELL